MGKITQPGGAVDGGPHVVCLVAQLHLACVQTDPQADRCKRRELQPQRERGGVAGAGERHNEAVTLALLHGAHPAVLGHQIRYHPVQACDRGAHVFGLGLP